MPEASANRPWNILPSVTVPPDQRQARVAYCSEFAAGVIGRFPAWLEGLDDAGAPDPVRLAAAIRNHGLEAGLRRFRNREMLGIIWRDLCGLAPLGETFAHLTVLAETCLQAAIDEHHRRLEEKHGTPRGEDGRPQRLFVIGLGKFGGVELNLSSDIDLIFCYDQGGSCDGRRGMANDQFFTRLARGVIASLSEITEEGFCFRVDTRLRPFGDSGPLTSSVAALEQYYQREGRDWERYALIKARPVAGEPESGARFIERIRPFVYRRYIDYSAVEALQDMHRNVQDDARRKDRLDDIKRGPGGIREIEFLAQCFQILRGGREPSLQTPSLDAALTAIQHLGLLDPQTVRETRDDYAYLRFLENRVQALRDQQTHRLPDGADRERIARAMNEDSTEALDESLAHTRDRVCKRFQDIFPERPEPDASHRWSERWRELQATCQPREPAAALPETDPMGLFLQRLHRIVLSQRARHRLDRFMPELLRRYDGEPLGDEALNRVFDLVLAICRRSAYLVLLVQHPKALDRMLELFAQSRWIATRVIRFPALLDELIDPALGRQIPGAKDLESSVDRILEAAQGTEAVLEGFNYLKLATELRVAVAQLQGKLSAADVQSALSNLAAALLRGILDIAGREIIERHGEFPGASLADHRGGALGIIGYGTLGAAELGYDSDLDLVFLFDPVQGQSNGGRPLPPDRYYARMAQRVLSFLTVMTPSGRLYEVDTRLRPNGRAGALVSSTQAFRDYQMNEAWTWELQALTRARFIAGSRDVAVAFNRIRLDALCRRREAGELAAELMEMRRRMGAEHSANVHLDETRSPKHRPGGLIDIEFIVQFGVLSSARLFPRVLQAHGTLSQLRELRSIDWLDEEEAQVLEQTLLALRQQRLMAFLVENFDAGAIDTSAAARVFEARLAAPG